MYVRRRLDEATETNRERPEEETRWRKGGFCFCFVLRRRGCRFKREKGLIEEMRCKTQLERPALGRRRQLLCSSGSQSGAPRPEASSTAWKLVTNKNSSLLFSHLDLLNQKLAFTHFPASSEAHRVGEPLPYSMSSEEQGASGHRCSVYLVIGS